MHNYCTNWPIVRVVTGHHYSPSWDYFSKRRCHKEPRVFTVHHTVWHSLLCVLFCTMSVWLSCLRTAITILNPSLLQAVMKQCDAEGRHLTDTQNNINQPLVIEETPFKTDFKYLWPKNANGLFWMTGSRAWTVSSTIW